MKTKFIAFLMFGALLFGCSSSAKKITSTYDASKGEGLIVGTICIEKKIYNGFTFVYADDKPSVNDYPNESGNFTYKYDSGHFNEKGKTYYLFSIAKPKGKYKFIKVKIFNNTRNDPSRFEVPMNIKFEIEEGKTTYLGQVNVNIQKKEFSVENQIERDRSWFAKKAPQIQF
jgi:hypothetical protein